MSVKSEALRRRNAGDGSLHKAFLLFCRYTKKDMDYSAELCYNKKDFGPFLRAGRRTVSAGGGCPGGFCFPRSPRLIRYMFAHPELPDRPLGEDSKLTY